MRRRHSDARTYGFVILSAMTHLALALAVATMNTRSEREVEYTEIEVIPAPAPGSQSSEAPVLALTSDDAEAPALSKEPTIPAVVPAELPEAKKTVAGAEIERAVETPKPVPVKAPSKAVAVLPMKTVHAKTSKPAPVTQKESPVVVPVAPPAPTESPVEEETTETAMPVPVPVPVPAQEVADEKAMEQEQEKAAALAQAQAEADARKLKAEQEAAQKAQAEQQKLAEEKAMAAAAAVAAAKAAEEAQAAKLAEEAKQAEAARQAEVAKMAPQEVDQGAVGEGSGEMAGNGVGSSEGQGNDVRGIDELRQRPGNRKPMYDAQDRLAGRQGQVAFLAYVSKEGSLSEFKMLQSSGHRELDAKTLKALKTWKFQPGQEGWVEIPFQWDLKGGPQEMPATLRRRAQTSPSPNNG